MRVTTGRATDDRVGFDGLRAVVGAGDGVVGRFPGIVCVARCSDPEPLRQFLAVCADVAGPEPGWELARRLATWMSGPDAPGPELRFGTVAAAGDKLAFYLVGEVDARVDAVGGLSLSGAHAAIGTDRLLPPPASPVVLSMDGGDVSADPADVHDLRAGVVPGSGVVLRPTGSGLDDVRHAEEDAGGVHEWFETGEAASDPFADPPRAPDVPVQRAGGVQVGGRNGVARELGPEATAEAPEPEPDDVPAAGAGRHALDLPDARADPLTYPLSTDFHTAEPDDPFGTDERRYPPGRGPNLPEPAHGAPDAERGYSADRHPDLPEPAWGASAEPRAEHGYPPERRPDSVGGARAEAGRDRGSDVPEPGRGTAAEPRSADLEQRRPRPFAGQGDPALADPDDPQTVARSGHAPEEPGPSLDGPSPATSNHGSEAPQDGPRSGPSASAWGAGSSPQDGSPPQTPQDGPRSGPSASAWGAGSSPQDGSPLVSRGPEEGAPAAGHALRAGGPRSGPPADSASAGRPAAPHDRALGERASPPPAESAGHALDEAPFGDERGQVRRDTLPVRARQPGRPRPGEPAAAAALFAPAHEQAREAAGSPIGLAPGSTPPAGFAPSPSRAPETRPPPPAHPSTATTPGLLFQPPDEATEKTAQRRGPRIRGYRCENGHLNDPRSPSCRECAAPIDERVGGLVAGPRPALGTLVFEDGAAHVVDGGYLIGARPDADDRVRTGELRPIVVDDGSVAPAHAEIRVSGWDVMVVDAGSRDGTYVSGPDESQWTPLPSRRSRRLLPGTRVRLGGDRTFVFESSSTVH